MVLGNMQITEELDSEVYQGSWPKEVEEFLVTFRSVVQQTCDWGRVIDLGYRDRAITVVVKNRNREILGALMGFFYESPMGNILLSMPGPGSYGGVVMAPQPEGRAKELCALLVDAFCQAGRDLGASFSTIVTPPLSDNASYLSCKTPDYIHENFYQFIDLNLPLGSGLSGKANANLQRKIRRALSSGLTSHILHGLGATSHWSDWISQWYPIHEARMRDVGAAPLDQSWFNAMATCLLEKDKMFVVSIGSEDGSVLGGGVFVGDGDVWDAYMINSNSDSLQRQPNSLIVLKAIEHLKERKVRFLNWQGASSRDSGVYRYKAEWGAIEGLYHYLVYKTGPTDRILNLDSASVRRVFGCRFVVPFSELRR